MLFSGCIPKCKGFFYALFRSLCLVFFFAFLSGFVGFCLFGGRVGRGRVVCGALRGEVRGGGGERGTGIV